MECPNCGSLKDKVIDTRQSRNGTVIRRRRECLDCGFRFTTYERLHEEKILVKKKKGNVEPFEKEKIERGIKLASKNRPVSENQIKDIADFIEKYIFEEGKFIIESSEIGKLVQKKLKEIDKIAYIRFKSVCNAVSDIEEFEKILEELKEN